MTTECQEVDFDKESPKIENVSSGIENGQAEKENEKKSCNKFNSTLESDICVDSTYLNSENEDWEEEEERDEGLLWDSQTEFVFTCLGYVLGFHNVWNFPYLCFTNGGGAFLLPYFTFLVVGGMPMVYMELGLGQYSKHGPLGIWKLAPLFKGLGFCMVLTCIVVAIYYSVILAWTVYYLVVSMTGVQPWTTCGNAWNTDACCETVPVIVNCSDYATVFNNSVHCHGCVRNNTIDVIAPYMAPYVQQPQNVTFSRKFVRNLTLPAEEYFYEGVLDLSERISDIGHVQWKLLLALLFVWVAIFLVLCRGIKSMGKFAYVSALIPYGILIVFLVRFCLLDGAKEGVMYYMQPKWHKLAEVRVWYDAARQVIQTLGFSYGTWITLGRYSRFRNDIHRDAMVLPVVNCLTSILCGFVLFPLLGFVAKIRNIDISQVLANEGGHGQRFIVLPAALSYLPNPTLWTVLTYMTSFFIGLSTIVVFVHLAVSSFLDLWPKFCKGRYILAVACTCGGMFLIGILLTTQAGLHIITLLDYHGNNLPVALIGTVECFLVAWIYGASKFGLDLWIMLGSNPGKWWALMWRFGSPTTFLFVLVYGLLEYKAPPVYIYEPTLTADGVGLVVTVLLVLPLPLFMIIMLIKTPGTFKQRSKAVLNKDESWGPGWDVNADIRGPIPDYIRSEKEELQDVTGFDNEVFTLSVEKLEKMDESNLTYLNSLGQLECDIDTGSIQWSEDENKARGNWTGRYDFLMSGLGYCVGIGNVWRFPYLVYKNGGGAFFIPYIIMVVFCGLPLLYMELAFGQYASLGPISIWKVSPIFKGMGYAGCCTTFLICIYYNVINAWSIFYFFASMTGNLPWTNCNNTWNTKNCMVRSDWSSNRINCSGTGTFQTNLTSISPLSNESAACDRTMVTPSEEYFFNYVLNVSDGIDNPGHIRWHLALCLLLAWIITFISLIKGVKSVGKIVYFTVLFPYIILAILLIRYSTLGTTAHLDGIKYYVTPQWDMLKQATVWADAASQLFFSLGLSMGGLISLSSFNRFHYDCYRDAYIICLVDTLSSVFAGFVIFAVLGVMAEEGGTDVEHVVSTKFALAYVTYPEAVTKLPIAPLWSMLFFLMLFFLAIDSQFLMVEGILIALIDEFNLYSKSKRMILVSVTCVVFYLLGLCMVTQGGLYTVVLFDSYVAAISPIVIGILMCIALGWIYGIPSFTSNIRAMLGKEPSLWWKALWCIVTPILLMFILVFSWVMYENPKYGEYEYPLWAHILALCISLVSVLCIPVVAVIQLYKVTNGFKKKMGCGIWPEKKWGPALLKHQLLVQSLPGSKRRYSATSVFSSSSYLSGENITDDELYTENYAVNGYSENLIPKSGEKESETRKKSLKQRKKSKAIVSTNEDGVMVFRRPKKQPPTKTTGSQTDTTGVESVITPTMKKKKYKNEKRKNNMPRKKNSVRRTTSKFSNSEERKTSPKHLETSYETNREGSVKKGGQNLKKSISYQGEVTVHSPDVRPKEYVSPPLPDFEGTATKQNKSEVTSSENNSNSLETEPPVAVNPSSDVIESTRI